MAARWHVDLAWLLAVVLCWAAGCTSYHATIVVESANSSPHGSVLSDSEVAQVRMAVSEAVQSVGLIVSPELDDVAKTSRENANHKKEVIALFVTPATSADYIEVVSAVDKTTGEFSVDVVQYGSPWPTQEAKEVEAAVLSAIQQELGTHRVRVERRKRRPSLSP